MQSPRRKNLLLGASLFQSASANYSIVCGREQLGVHTRTYSVHTVASAFRIRIISNISSADIRKNNEKRPQETLNSLHFENTALEDVRNSITFTHQLLKLNKDTKL